MSDGALEQEANKALLESCRDGQRRKEVAEAPGLHRERLAELKFSCFGVESVCVLFKGVCVLCETDGEGVLY